MKIKCSKCGKDINVTPWRTKRSKNLFCSYLCKSLFQIGKGFSEETLLKMRMSQLGRKHTTETKQKMSKWQIGKKLSDETKQKIAEAHKGKTLTQEHKDKVSKSLIGNARAKGIKHTDEARRHMAISSQRNVANGKNPLYIDGRSKERKSERRLAMGNVEYRIWRDAVLIRDNYTCQECGKRGGDLHAHHIRTWRDFPELRYVVDNGQTLYVGCHRELPSSKCVKDLQSVGLLG